MNTENYTVNISDKIQNDIIACVDGFMETMDGTPNMDTMKLVLCQIIVDNRKNSRGDSPRGLTFDNNQIHCSHDEARAEQGTPRAKEPAQVHPVIHVLRPDLKRFICQRPD